MQDDAPSGTGTRFTQRLRVLARSKVAWALAAVLGVAATAGVALLAPQRGQTDVALVSAGNLPLEQALASFQQAWQALEEEGRSVKAGKLSEIESDQRSRTVHAPRFLAVSQALSRVQLPADDPRAPLVADYRHFAMALTESLAMESAVIEGKVVPASPARAAVLQIQLERLSARIAVQLQDLKTRDLR